MNLETIEDDSGPAAQEACPICGETNYYLDGGFYYCSLCNTQSQSVRHYVDENYRPEVQMRHGVATLRQKKSKGTKSQESSGHVASITTWEICNIILKHMADRLVDIGFPECVRAKIFHLYISFMKKRGVIFVSKSNSKAKSRVTVGEPTVNLQVLYGAQREPRTRKNRVPFALQRRKRHKNMPLLSAEDQDLEEEKFMSRSQIKLRKSLAKKKVIEQEYLAKAKILGETDLEFEEFTEQQQQENLIKKKAEDRNKNLHLKFTAAADKVRKKFLKGVNVKRHLVCTSAKKGMPTQKRYERAKAALKTERFTYRTCLVVAYVALRVLGFPVFISDMIRLCHTGTFLNDNLAADIKSYKDYHDLNVKVIPSCYFANLWVFDAPRFSRAVEEFVEYMGLQEFPIPQMKEIVPKFIDEFMLPREFECLANIINHMFTYDNYVQDSAGSSATRDHNYTSTSTYTTVASLRALPEVIVMVQFIVLLKMLFGLDDKTEKFQSEFARLVNKTIKSEVSKISKKGFEMEDWTELFVIEDWLGFLRRRREVVQRELCCSGAFVPNNPISMTKLAELTERCALTGEPVADSRILGDKSEPDLFKSCYETLDSIVKETLTSPVVPLKPYIPLPLPSQSVLEQYLERYPMVADSSVKPELLKADFVKKRIDFVWKPKKYAKLLQLCGYKVRIIQGDAVNNWPEELNGPVDDKSKLVYVFQPYKSFDEFVGRIRSECSASMKLLLALCEDIIVGESPDRHLAKFSRNSMFQKQVNFVGDMYCKRVVAGFIPILTKWYEPDSD